MKDVEKTNIERANSGKRMRRRRRSMNFYAAVVLAFALASFIAMSYTFLFNIENIVVIVVSGEDSETEEEVQRKGDEVAKYSGAKKGDNLLRINTEKSAEKILDNVSFVETAEVHRDFPSTLEIKVAYCVPSFNVEYSGGVLVVSKLGKILENNSFITDGLPTISGIQPLTTQQGEMLSSSNEHKNEALSELMASISDDSGISGIDINDEFGIIINYTNGTMFKMGNWNDAEYKLNLAGTVMKDGSINGKKGYLTMIGSNQCTFRTSDEPVGVIGSEQQIPTDAEGNTIAQNIGEEVNPEQEAIFSEFNSRAEENGGNVAGGNESGYTYNDQYNGYDYNYGYNDYDYNYDYDNSDYGFNWGNDGW
ncbi:MAG: FtsQ-type POTRA domain-containing protein [Ruminococcus sp.]|nr:FtsQ-type POTRA domain-containing protein [Ruminococcus sp.]